VQVARWIEAVGFWNYLGKWDKEDLITLFISGNGTVEKPFIIPPDKLFTNF